MASETPRLEAEARERTGTRYARRLRQAGKLPVVLYGHGEAPAHLSVDRDTMIDCLHEGAHVLEVRHDGQSETCLIRDVQYDYLGTNVIHMDLTRIDLNEEVTVYVRIHVKGEEDCPGLKEEGAFVAQHIVDLEVNCLANAIPEEIVVDISELGAEESITIGDLNLPEGVTTEHEPEESVLTIEISKVEAEAEEEAAEAAAGEEPEVLSERKEEEEEEGVGESEKEKEKE